MKKSLFLTFCFALVPGAGQMYQNYMKRGLSLMCLAGIALILAVMIETVIFIVPLFIIVAYSFFDTFNIRSEIGTENAPKDAYIFLNNLSLDKLKGNRLLGIGLILIGIYILFNNIFYGLAIEINNELLIDMVKAVRNYFPSLIVSAITLDIGIKMLRKE